MESFFEYDFILDEDEYSNFNVDDTPNVPPTVKVQSAFVPYVKQRSVVEAPAAARKSRSMMNVKNRMVEFLKKNWTPPAVNFIESSAVIEAEKERNRRHMMNERMRREKEKQNYNRLRKLLPPNTKRDKKSIVQMAARKIEEMESNKAKLEKKNKELSEGTSRRISMEEAKIKIRVENPSSGIDSMLEVLYCLKNNGAIPTSIQSNFSPMEFSSMLQIKTSKKAAEVEKAVEKTLFDVEQKFQWPNVDMDKHTSSPSIK